MIKAGSTAVINFLEAISQCKINQSTNGWETESTRLPNTGFYKEPSVNGWLALTEALLH